MAVEVVVRAVRSCLTSVLDSISPSLSAGTSGRAADETIGLLVRTAVEDSRTRG